MRAGPALEFLPLRHGSFLFALPRGGDRQFHPILWKIFCPKITNGQIRAANKRSPEQCEEDHKDQTALGEAAHPSLWGRWFDPGAHRFGSFVRPICAATSLSYKFANPSDRVRVPAIIGMKFVSPLQRGTI